MAVTVAEYRCVGCAHVATTEDDGALFHTFCTRCRRSTDWLRLVPLLDHCASLGLDPNRLRFARYLWTTGRLSEHDEEED
jgi:hypothetical protein